MPSVSGVSLLVWFGLVNSFGCCLGDFERWFEGFAYFVLLVFCVFVVMIGLCFLFILTYMLVGCEVG